MRKLNFGRNVLVIFSACVAIASTIATGQSNPSPQAQSAVGPAPANQTPTATEWQAAARNKMEFDVASVRQSPPGTFTPPNFPLSRDDSYTPNGGLFSADFPLVVYIEFAYKLWLTNGQRRLMLARLPKWVSAESFTIHARRNGSPTKDQMRLMVQSLLASRFKLAIHFESQNVPAFALTLARTGKIGPTIRPHAEGPPCETSAPQSGQGFSSGHPVVFPRECNEFGLSRRPDHTFLAGARDATMELIAASLASLPGGLDRPVVDRTGLAGKYDFRIEWTSDASVPGTSTSEAQPDSQGVGFLEAIKEQLGLRLEPIKAPINVLVIDHVERPSDN
jgi:bla regulator protein BlaR1